MTFFFTMRDRMKLSVVEMILIMRPTKVSREQSCLTTPCMSCCPWKVKKLRFYQFSVNILKTIVDKMKLSVDEMILMISPTKVFMKSKLLDNSLLELLSLKMKGKHFTRWAIKTPGRFLFILFVWTLSELVFKQVSDCECARSFNSSINYISLRFWDTQGTCTCKKIKM